MAASAFRRARRHPADRRIRRCRDVEGRNHQRAVEVEDEEPGHRVSRVHVAQRLQPLARRLVHLLDLPARGQGEPDPHAESTRGGRRTGRCRGRRRSRTRCRAGGRGRSRAAGARAHRDVRRPQGPPVARASQRDRDPHRAHGEADLARRAGRGCRLSSSQRPFPPRLERSPGPRPVASTPSSQPRVSSLSAKRPAPATCTT